MIKAKFGGALRSKTPTARVNEALAKILYHNICVLIQSMYELGFMPILSAPRLLKQESCLFFKRLGNTTFGARPPL